MDSYKSVRLRHGQFNIRRVRQLDLGGNLQCIARMLNPDSSYRNGLPYESAIDNLKAFERLIEKCEKLAYSLLEEEAASEALTCIELVRHAICPAEIFSAIARRDDEAENLVEVCFRDGWNAAGQRMQDVGVTLVDSAQREQTNKRKPQKSNAINSAKLEAVRAVVSDGDPKMPQKKIQAKLRERGGSGINRDMLRDVLDVLRLEGVYKAPARKRKRRK